MTTPSESHASGDEAGVIKQVTAVLNPTPEVAKPLVPVRVVKAIVPPGITDLVSDVATGPAGIDTVGVIVAVV